MNIVLLHQGLLSVIVGKERGVAASTFSHADDENEDNLDNEDHDDISCSEEQLRRKYTPRNTLCILPKPGEESLLDTGIIPQSPCHTWIIIFQTKFRIFAFCLVHCAVFSIFLLYFCFLLFRLQLI